MGQERGGAKSTIHSNEQYYRGKRIQQNQNIKEHMQRQSQKEDTDKNAHKADMQILQKQPSLKTMLGIWEDMHRMQKNWPLQSSVQKQED